MVESLVRTVTGPRGVLALVVLAGGLLAAPVMGQGVPKDAEFLRDFIHYVRIDRSDLAKQNAERLLARLEKPYGEAEAGKGLTLSQFVAIVEDSGELARFEESAAAAMRKGELESVAARLMKGYTTGKLAQARGATQIEKNVMMLTGAQRERLLARERLAAAGEYAVPQLLQSLLKRVDAVSGAEAKELLADMGRHAVLPLTAALPGLDPAAQEQVANVLGEIPYRTSLPALYDLAQASKVEAVRVACQRAIAKIDGAYNGQRAVGEQYAELAEAYYGGSNTLLSFPGEEHQLLWSFDPTSGLNPVPVKTAVFHEAMAMRLAERGLQADAGNQTLLALWLSANFRREIETPAGYANPAYAADRRDAMYYAVAAGPSACKLVLARALDRKDAVLARKAIAALEASGGVTALVATESGRSPLIEALRYANRRVQYDAALAVATAQPFDTFDGSDRVVPILGGAIRDAGQRFAVVLAARGEEQQSLANMLRGLGYTVLPPGTSIEAVSGAINESPAVDVAVVSLPAEAAAAALASLRGASRTSAAPVLALLSEEGVNRLGKDLTADPLTRVLRSGTSPTQQAEAMKQLVDQAQGGVIDATEAKAYQTRALAALRELAIANSPVLPVLDAAPALLTALGEAKGELRLRIAEVIARIDDRRAQRALADAVLNSEGTDRLVLATELTRSAKRFGNMLDQRQVTRLLGAARAGGLTDEAATVFAAVVGALGVPNPELVKVVVNPAKTGS